MRVAKAYLSIYTKPARIAVEMSQGEITSFAINCNAISDVSSVALTTESPNLSIGTTIVQGNVATTPITAVQIGSGIVNGTITFTDGIVKIQPFDVDINAV